MSAHLSLTSVKPFLIVTVFVDEAVIPFKGRLAIKVRMPDKPVKFGVKFFVLCDAKADIARMLSFMLAKMIEQLEILSWS